MRILERQPRINPRRRPGPALSATARRLQGRLTAFGIARRRARALRYASRGALIGGVLAMVVGSLAQVFGADGVQPIALVLVVFLPPVLLSAALGWLRPVRDEDVAFDLDHALGLDERVITAYEFSRSVERTASNPSRASGSTGLLRDLLADEQIADALARLDEARPGAVYPTRLPRSWLLTTFTGVVLAVLPWIVPWPMVFGGATPASQVAATNEAQAARLDTLAHQLDPTNASLDPASRAQLASQLRQAAANLRRDETDSSQASQDLLRAEQAAAATSPQTGEDAALTLARIADALNAQAATQAVTKSLDNQNAAAAASAMNQITQGVGQMTSQQRDAIANALQAASSAARNSDTNASQQLQQAANAVRQGDPNGASQAGQAIQQLGAASQAQQDATRVQSELQASRDAVNQAAQSSTDPLNQNLSSGSASDGSSSDGQSPSGDQSSSASQDAQSAASASTASSDAANGSGDQSSANNSPESPADSPNGPGGSDGSGSANGSNGDANGQQPGGGYGTGSTDHLGSPRDPTGLAEREVVVPNDPNAPMTGISATNQTQVGAVTDARVDYQTVLPTYRQQAIQGVDSGAVPNDLRNVVKGYFDSLAAK